MGINFHFHINKDTQSLDYRDLTGPKKLKLFQNINISTLLQGSNNAQDLQVIWDDFIDSIKELKKDYSSEESIAQLKGRIDA